MSDVFFLRTSHLLSKHKWSFGCNNTINLFVRVILNNSECFMALSHLDAWGL